MKFTFAVFVVITTLSSCHSQHFGVKGGINLNKISFEGAPSQPVQLYQNNVGFHVGVFSRYTLVERLTISPELQFIQKGADSGNERINLNYLELPVVFSFAPLRVLSLEAGPSISYLVSAKTSNPSARDVISPFDKPFDFGLNAGVRINLTNKISITGRYYYGLSSVRSFPQTLPDTNPTCTNRNFQMGISYLFKK
jgi:hypothetical protein